MTLLSAGHLGTDFANGALPALLPFLVDRFGLSYTLAATLMLASAVSSSVIQPLFGLWSDRRGALWLLPAGVGVAGVGIALAADAPSYWLVLLLVVVSGVGVAAYHPEGSKFAAYASGRRRASGMSAFSIGGNVGFALGPIVATPLVVAFGLVTFVPLWEVSLGHSKAHGNHLLALMLLTGGLGTIVAGPLADRLGRRPVLLASLVATGPLILVFVVVGGIPGAIALALVGACVIGTFGVTMVMSQEYLPRHIGMASGLSIGLSIGLGGVAAVALGALADAVDLRSALYVCAAAPLVAPALALPLPSSRPGRRPQVEPLVP